MLERAGRALGRPAETVAQALPPAHHGAALAYPPQARRVGGHDDPGARRLRGAQLAEPQPRDEGVRVHHIGPLRAEPAVESLGSAHGDLALAFLARGGGGNRVAIDGDTIMLVSTLGHAAGFRRGHEHLLPRLAKAAAEPGHVDFRPPETVRVIPAHGLDDLHAFTATHVMMSPSSRSARSRRKRASVAHHSRTVARVGSALMSHTRSVVSRSMRQPRAGSSARSVRALIWSTLRWVQSKWPSHSLPKSIWLRLSRLVVLITRTVPGAARGVRRASTANGSRKCSSTAARTRVPNGRRAVIAAGSSSFSTSQTHVRSGPSRSAALAMAHSEMSTPTPVSPSASRAARRPPVAQPISSTGPCAPWARRSRTISW